MREKTMAFYKVRWLKCSFCNTVYSQCFRNFSDFTNSFLHIPLKIGNKVKKILISAYSIYMIFIWSLKILLCFAQFTFFPNDYNYNVVSILPNIAKIEFKTNNVYLTLFKVVNFNVDFRNVLSTLIWCCATLKQRCLHQRWNLNIKQRRDNLKATLKQRWNVRGLLGRLTISFKDLNLFLMAKWTIIRFLRFYNQKLFSSVKQFVSLLKGLEF